MSENDFISILKRNNEDEIRQFILQYGKPPKPFCPIYFFQNTSSITSKGDSKQ